MALASSRPVAALIPRIERRKLLGIGLAALAALLVLNLTRPPPTISVLVAASDIPSGQPLDRGMVTTREVASSNGLVEGSGLGDIEGWTVGVSLSAGEPLLPSLLRPPELLSAGNLISIGVERSHAVLGLVTTGDSIDVYVTWPSSIDETPITELLASDVFVVETSMDERSGISLGEVSLVLAVDDTLAAALAKASRSGELDIVQVTP